MSSSVQAVTPQSGSLLETVRGIRAGKKSEVDARATIEKDVRRSMQISFDVLLKKVFGAKENLDARIEQEANRVGLGYKVEVVLFELETSTMRNLGIEITHDPAHPVKPVTNNLLLKDLFESIESKGLKLRYTYDDFGYRIFAYVPENVANPSAT